MIEAINSYNGKLISSNDSFIHTSHHKRTSLIFWIYIGLSKFLNLSALNISYFFLIFEFLLIPFSGWFLLKALKVKNPFLLSTFYTWIILFTNIEENNFAHYGQLFNGEWYNIPNSLFLLVLGNFAKNKFSNSIYLLLLSFLIHPSKGAMFIFAIVPFMMFTVAKRKHELKSLFTPIIISTIISSLFIYFLILGEFGNTMNSQLWIEITRSHSYHFFRNSPDLVFAVSSLLPIVLLTLSLSILLKDKNISFVPFAMLAVSLIGQLIDFYSNSPSLVLLGLNRLSENIIYLAILLLFVNTQDNYLQKTIEFSGFYILIFNPVESLRYFILILFLILFLFLKNKNNLQFLKLLTIFFVIFSEYIHQKDGNFIFNNTYVFTIKNFLLITSFIAVLYFSSQFLKMKLDINILTIVFLLLFGLIFIYSNFKDTDSENIFTVKTNGYLDAQVWAKHNTPQSAIFMPDPYINYAWRDLSLRNSFGTPREFVTSWLYKQDYKIFEDAVNRSSIFIENPIEKMIKFKYRDFNSLIANSYYRDNIFLHEQLCEIYKVDYFLWTRNLEYPDYFEMIFESSSHYILKLRNDCR